MCPVWGWQDLASGQPDVLPPQTENLSALQRTYKILRRKIYRPIRASIERPIVMYGRKQSARAAIPNPLPERTQKHRALSLPRNNRPQSQGGEFFAKFPYEIRRMIYIYVLGDEIIHLDHPSTKPRIAHYRCEWITEDGGSRMDNGGYHSHNAYGPMSKDFRQGKMGLVKTCRAIYIEATDILYTTNTFSVQTCANLEIFIWFTQSIRPCRLASITDVYINMLADCFAPFWTDLGPGSRFWDFIRDWGRVWTIMATRMPALRIVRVRLRRTAQELGLSTDEDWMRPMLRVRGLKRFDFTLEGNGVYREWSAEYCERLSGLQEYLSRTLCAERKVGESFPKPSTCWKTKRPCQDGICCKKGAL